MFNATDAGNPSGLRDRPSIAALKAGLDVIAEVSKVVRLRKQGHEYVGLCPFHEERTPSFSVFPGRGGEYRCHCHGCGWDGDVLDFMAETRGMDLGELLDDLDDGLVLREPAAPRAVIPFASPEEQRQRVVAPVPDDAPDASFAHFKFGEPSAFWTWRNALGQVLFHTVRFDPPGEKKQVLPRSWVVDSATGEGAWQWKRPDSGLLPLNADVIASAPRYATVIVGEGEKTAEAIAACGYLATTWVGGSKAVDKTDWSLLFGRDVVFCRDNDDGGLQAQDQFVAIARKVGVRSLRCMLVPPKKPKGWDLADEPAEDRERYIKRALKAPPIIAPEFDLDDFRASAYVGDPGHQEFAVAGIFPRSEITLLAGEGGVGKSGVVLEYAYKTAILGPNTGLPQTVLGRNIERFGTVVMLCAEDARKQLHRRMRKLDPAFDQRDRSKLILLTYPDMGGPVTLFGPDPDTGAITPTQDWHDLRARLSTIDDLVAVVIDPIGLFVQLDGNSYQEVYKIYGHMSSLGIEFDCLPLMTTHTNKSNSKLSADEVTDASRLGSVNGSMAWVNGSRLTYVLWGVGPDAERKWAAQIGLQGFEPEDVRKKFVCGKVLKDNLDDVCYKQFVFMREDCQLMDISDRLATAKRVERDEETETFVQAVAKAAEAGNPYTIASKTSGLDARKVELPGKFKVASRRDLQLTAQRLVESGRLVLSRFAAPGADPAKAPCYLDKPGGPLHEADLNLTDAVERESAKDSLDQAKKQHKRMIQSEALAAFLGDAVMVDVFLNQPHVALDNQRPALFLDGTPRTLARVREALEFSKKRARTSTR